MAVYLATLRPAAISPTTSSHVSGTFQMPAAPVALSDLAEAPDAIAFVRFFMRAGWYSAGVGPNNPSAALQWRVGAGPYGNGDVELPPQGVGVVQEFVSADIETNPDGGAWTMADLAALEMRTTWFADDNGSGVETVAVLSDEPDHQLWAEVWGTPATGTNATPLALNVSAAAEVGTIEAGPQGAVALVAAAEAGAVEAGAVAIDVSAGAVAVTVEAE